MSILIGLFHAPALGQMSGKTSSRCPRGTRSVFRRTVQYTHGLAKDGTTHSPESVIFAWIHTLPLRCISTIRIAVGQPTGVLKVRQRGRLEDAVLIKTQVQKSGCMGVKSTSSHFAGPGDETVSCVCAPVVAEVRDRIA